MQSTRGYRVVPFSLERRMVAASATVGRAQNNIHVFTEVDISLPRRLMREHQARTGERLSLTTYIVACLARTVAEYPAFNARRRGSRLYLLDEVTISVLVERTIDGQPVPDMLAVHAADTKSYRQIQTEIRGAQRPRAAAMGALSGIDRLLRLIPSALFTLFVRLAARSVTMARRYGVVGVTAVGMFGPRPMWVLPLSGATVAVAVGSIVARPVFVNDGFEAASTSASRSRSTTT